MKKLTVKIISLIMAVVLLSSSLTAFAAENKFGIDVSRYNTSVDYVEQVNGGKSFAMIRLGNYNHLDTEFWNHVEGACNAGMDFGVYLYSYAFSLEEAQIEADFVLQTLSEMPDEYKEHCVLPVAYDVEDEVLTKYGKTQLTAQVMLFCGEMEKAGYVPMVYANTNWFNNYLDINQIADEGYKIWLANWVSNPAFTSKKEVGTTGIYADMWQYAEGDTSTGELDKDVLYDLDDLKHIHKRTVSKATASANGKITYDNCSLCGAAKAAETIYHPKTVTLSATSYTYSGSAKKPTVTVKDSAGKTISSANYTVSYSGNTNVGTATAKITFKGNYSGTISKTFKINPKNTSISSVTAQYKGFTVKLNKYTTQTTGYQIQYSTSSKFSSAKTVSVSNTTTSKTVTGLTAKKKYYVRVRTYRTVGSTKYYSAWSGAKTVTTSSYPTTITLSATSYTYNGKAKKPTVTVKNNGTKISSKYYTVSYSSGRKNVGKYTVTIKFKAPYSGTVKKTFTIKPKATTLSSVTAKSKGFTVKWKKQATQTTGYQIQYSTSSSFSGAKTVTVTKNSTTSKTVTGLTGNKKYYVRIRTYKTVSGTKYYSSWSKAKTVTTKK